MQKVPLPHFLQQHGLTKKQLPNFFSQITNAAESLQMTINPYLGFLGTGPKNSVEDYLNTVIANLFLVIGPEPVNTPLHQNWIQRRTTIIQTTLDGAAQT